MQRSPQPTSPANFVTALLVISSPFYPSALGGVCIVGSHPTPAAAKSRLDHALNQVFDTLSEPVRRDGYAAATWVNAHLTCCLADEVTQLRAEAMA